MKLPFNLSISLCLGADDNDDDGDDDGQGASSGAAISSSRKNKTHSRVVCQVMVHRSVVKVLGFSCTPSSPSSARGDQYGGMRDTGG